MSRVKKSDTLWAECTNPTSAPSRRPVSFQAAAHGDRGAEFALGEGIRASPDV